MKKIAIVALIILVFATIGFYSYLELSVPEIEYVSDNQKIIGVGNEFSVKRLYSSDIDYDKLTTILDSTLVSTEFSEDDIYRAALAAGTPQFYPSFYFNVQETEDPQIIKLRGTINQELAEGQESTNFRLDSLLLECVSSGFLINDATMKATDENAQAFSAPVISQDGTNLAMSIGDTGYYEIELQGTSGTLQLQYLFNVSSSSLFDRVMLEDQILLVNVSITATDSVPNVTFSVADYTSTEDFE